MEFLNDQLYTLKKFFKNTNSIFNSLNISDTVVNCTIRASYGYSGQKCSACSRIYVPESKWAEVSFPFTSLFEICMAG